MSLQDYRRIHPEYKTVSDRKLVGALHKVYGEGENFQEFAVKAKAEHVQYKDETEKEQRMKDAPGVVATQNYIAERYKPEQVFDDNRGNTFRGESAGQGQGLVAKESSEAIMQDLRIKKATEERDIRESAERQYKLRQQVGTAEDVEFFGAGFEEYYNPPSESRYADRGYYWRLVCWGTRGNLLDGTLIMTFPLKLTNLITGDCATPRM